MMHSGWHDRTDGLKKGSGLALKGKGVSWRELIAMARVCLIEVTF